MMAEIRPQMKERIKHIHNLIIEIEKEVYENDPEDLWVDISYISMILEELLEGYDVRD